MNWTSVEDALPEAGTEVLVWVEGHRGPAWRNNHHLVAYLGALGGEWWEERHDNQPLIGVTHWAPLPEPPGGEK